MERQDATACGTKMARQHAGSHRMLRARTKTTQQSGGEELMKARGEAAGYNGKPEHTVADTENHAPSDVRNDKPVQSLKDTAQRIIDGRKGSDRHIAHAEFFHHERIDNAQHRRLKMVNE